MKHWILILRIFLWWLVCFLVSFCWTFLLVSVSFCGGEITSTGYSSSTLLAVLFAEIVPRFHFRLILWGVNIQGLCGLLATEAGCELRLSWLSNMIHCSFQSHWLPGFSSPSCKCDLYSVFLDVWPCIWLYWDAWLEESQLINIGLLCVTAFLSCRAGSECTTCT